MKSKGINLPKKLTKTSQNAGWYFYFFLLTEASFELTINNN